MTKYDYDLFIIGGGSGGIRAARWASQLGAKVALCESDRLGGTCVIRGCIPKKLMVYASSFKTDFKIAQDYGWDLESPKLNWDKMQATRNKEISRLEACYRDILTKNNVQFVTGAGRLKDEHSVQVQNKTYTAKYILIAVGAFPKTLSIPGSQYSINSNDIFSLKQQPKSLLVLGAGYIGLEFASIFAALGTKVSVLFRKSHILSSFDLDIRKHLQQELSQKGIRMLSNSQITKITKDSSQLQITDHQNNTWSEDLVLMATGRQANIQNLNLEALNITTQDSLIAVNNLFQTSCPSVFAIGDCIKNSHQLTPVALNEACFVSEYLFSKTDKSHFNYENIPSAVFTQPEVASVGLTEEQALKKSFQVVIYESKFTPLRLSLSKHKEKSYIKLIVCKKTDRLLGCHIIDHQAGEILQGFAVAIQNKLRKSDLDKTIGIHPSSAEELVTMRTPRS